MGFAAIDLKSVKLLSVGFIMLAILRNFGLEGSKNVCATLTLSWILLGFACFHFGATMLILTDSKEEYLVLKRAVHKNLGLIGFEHLEYRV